MKRLYILKNLIIFLDFESNQKKKKKKLFMSREYENINMKFRYKNLTFSIYLRKLQLF